MATMFEWTAGLGRAAATAVLLMGATAAGPVRAVADEPPPDAARRIVRLDPRLDKLLPADAKFEKLAQGFDWSEGPVWAKDGGYLLFSDVPQNTIYSWTEAAGARLFMKPSGFSGSSTDSKEPGSNGLLIDAEGRLVLCQHGDRRVARVEKDGTKTTLADKFDGKRLNSPNDADYAKNGNLYFTDPPYGLLGLNDSPVKELKFNGVYLLRKDGQVVLLTDKQTFPNGVALSPDEKTLYVANSDPKMAAWYSYPVKEDGTIGEGKVFFDATKWVGKEKPGLPDGLKLDKDGNIYATGPGGVLIFAPDGAHIGTIETGVPTGNCTWGDDGSTLYVTADMYLGRVKTATKGKGW
ncbi:MAG: SMP-30/gluconolactonase/LRE family protein [Planctomycetia bacterium]